MPASASVPVSGRGSHGASAGAPGPAPAAARAGLAAEWPTGKSESESRPLRLVGSESLLSGPARALGVYWTAGLGGYSLGLGPPGLWEYSEPEWGDSEFMPGQIAPFKTWSSHRALHAPRFSRRAPLGPSSWLSLPVRLRLLPKSSKARDRPCSKLVKTGLPTRSPSYQLTACKLPTHGFTGVVAHSPLVEKGNKFDERHGCWRPFVRRRVLDQLLVPR